jgi:hypothetical protein
MYNLELQLELGPSYINIKQISKLENISKSDIYEYTIRHNYNLIPNWEPILIILKPDYIFINPYDLFDELIKLPKDGFMYHSNNISNIYDNSNNTNNNIINVNDWKWMAVSPDITNNIIYKYIIEILFNKRQNDYQNLVRSKNELMKHICDILHTNHISNNINKYNPSWPHTSNSHMSNYNHNDIVNDGIYHMNLITSLVHNVIWIKETIFLEETIGIDNICL